MKKLLLFLLINLLVLIATSSPKPPRKMQLLPPKQTLKLIQENQDAAITIGSGDKDVYAFIDPLCSMSQEFLKLAYAQPRYLKTWRIHLFLYHLPGKKSQKHIQTILNSTNPESNMKLIMLKKIEIPLEEATLDTEEKIEQITEMAEEIGVFKRPYILFNGKVK